jgi:hypothetical protein
MKLWHNLRCSAFQGFRPTYDKLHDEEHLEKEREFEWKQRHENSSDVWPRKATVWFFLLLVDLTILVMLLHTLKPLITLLRLNEQLFSPRVTLPSPSFSNYRNGTVQSNRIPLILHQTTATEEIPERWIQPQQSCKKAYSDFEYKVRLIIFMARRDDMRGRQSSCIPHYIHRLLIITFSYGLTSRRAISCLSTTRGSCQYGTIMHSLSNEPTRFAILSCITMGGSTWTWIQCATIQSQFTNSDRRESKTTLYSNQPFPLASRMTCWSPPRGTPSTHQQYRTYPHTMRSLEAGLDFNRIALS